MKEDKKIYIPETIIKDAYDFVKENFERTGYRQTLSYKPKNTDSDFITGGNYIDGVAQGWHEASLKSFFFKIDLWTISLFGKIKPSMIIKYSSFLHESRPIHFGCFHIHSDYWNVYSVSFRNGWQNLALNENFKINQTFIDFAEKTTTTIYDDMTIGMPEAIKNGTEKWFDKLKNFHDLISPNGLEPDRFRKKQIPIIKLFEKK